MAPQLRLRQDKLVLGDKCLDMLETAGEMFFKVLCLL